MKQWFSILILLVLTCAINSCGGHADRASLVGIDSLIMQNPDSACELLAAYSADSLTTDDDRAYHALLTTIAHYKAYHPASSDSTINIAVSHYDHDGANPVHRMRSLLYKGCVMEELGDNKAAMRSYKEAQYACPDNDNFHKGFIHFRISGIYKSTLKYQEAIKHLKLASQDFPEENQYVPYCYDQLGKLYITLNADSAVEYIQKSIHIAQNSGDSTTIFKKYIDLAHVHYLKNEYSKSINFALKSIRNFTSDFKESDAYYIACQSYLKLHEIDSAKNILNQAPPAQTQADSLQMLSCLSDLASATNDFTHSQEYTMKCDTINTSIDSMLTDNSIIAIENEVDLEHEQKLNSQRVKWMAIMGAVGLIVILCLVFKSRRNKQFAKKLQQEVNSLKQNMATSFEELEALKQKGEEDGQQVEQIISSIDTSLECYSEVMGNLLNHYKTTSTEKNKKIHEMFDEEFFSRLHRYINIRYNNLVEKLQQGDFKLKAEEINIICLELSKFPNAIIWVYSNCDRPRSIHLKKKLIAEKVNHSKSIADIPQNI